MTIRELIELLENEEPDDEVAISMEGKYTGVFHLGETRLTDGTRILLLDADD